LLGNDPPIGTPFMASVEPWAGGRAIFRPRGTTEQTRIAGVFASYRRADSAYALLLYKAFTQKFGSARVFRDFESIAPGQDFVALPDAALTQCAACVVIAGRGWLDALDRSANSEDLCAERSSPSSIAVRSSFPAWWAWVGAVLFSDRGAQKPSDHCVSWRHTPLWEAH
jgi:hypothetical protein